MKRAAVLLLEMQRVSRSLYFGRNAMTPCEKKELWLAYQKAEAELHWIIPPAAEFPGRSLNPNYREQITSFGIDTPDQAPRAMDLHNQKCSDRDRKRAKEQLR